MSDLTKFEEFEEKLRAVRALPTASELRRAQAVSPEPRTERDTSPPPVRGREGAASPQLTTYQDTSRGIFRPAAIDLFVDILQTEDGSQMSEVLQELAVRYKELTPMTTTNSTQTTQSLTGNDYIIKILKKLLENFPPNNVDDVRKAIKTVDDDMEGHGSVNPTSTSTSTSTLSSSTTKNANGRRPLPAAPTSTSTTQDTISTRTKNANRKRPRPADDDEDNESATHASGKAATCTPPSNEKPAKRTTHVSHSFGHDAELHVASVTVNFTGRSANGVQSIEFVPGHDGAATVHMKGEADASVVAPLPLPHPKATRDKRRKTQTPEDSEG